MCGLCGQRNVGSSVIFTSIQWPILKVCVCVCVRVRVRVRVRARVCVCVGV